MISEVFIVSLDGRFCQQSSERWVSQDRPFSLQKIFKITEIYKNN